MVLGILPVSEVDVRSRVWRDAARDEDPASVASGDGDNVCELTSLPDGVSEDIRQGWIDLQSLKSCKIGQTTWKHRTHI